MILTLSTPPAYLQYVSYYCSVAIVTVGDVGVQFDEVAVE